MRIVIIGSGNVATHLAIELKNIGEDIVQIFSRNLCHAEELASKVGCVASNNISSICTDADIYLFSIKDDALQVVAKQISERIPETSHPLFIHTAGSVSIDIFSGITSRYGVLYPMQTFSKVRKVEFSRIPCFIEASDDDSLYIIKGIAERLSKNVEIVDSNKRRYLHLAAVFACNLTNHCYRLAEKVLEKEGLDFQLFLPLIEETARKVTEMSPKDAQTGPMVRYDQSIMNSQLSLITEERTKNIYRLMAESIHEDSTGK